MSPSQAFGPFGDRLMTFVDQLLARLVAQGLAERMGDQIRLTRAGREAAGYRAGDVVGDADLLASLGRLARAVDLEVPRYVP